MRRYVQSILLVVAGGLLGWQLVRAVAFLSVFYSSPSLAHEVALVGCLGFVVLGCCQLFWPQVSAWFTLVAVAMVLPYLVPFLPAFLGALVSTRWYETVPFALMMVATGLAVRTIMKGKHA